ncbi:IS5 family transposase [Synechococcus sp. PCC 7336]|uniref:IS5 family transposase n=1 Tax=Synechococcus sp. PCC 7336 TaxID=195250 RepID=UPI00034B2003|nr:IS5 family transposase [Synechococcus sp. PCC 7336]
MGQKGFWDWEERRKKLSSKKPLLDRLNDIVPWEEFRPLLEQIHQKERKSNAGRKPFDVILMFKLLLLQQFYNISDEELEYQVNDRLSFMQFLDLDIEDTIPDAKTVWSFREQLTKHGLTRVLFEKFENYLSREGYHAQEGQIVDATLVPVPKQRNSRKENEKIRDGEIPEEWEDKPHRLAQKDLEARWTKKNGQSHFGYKNHISIDVKFGFVRQYQVTDAAVHDSRALGEVIDIENSDDRIWADSAYRSEDIEWVLETIGFDSEIHERAYRNRPLNEEQKSSNRKKSSTRAKVKHVFGAWVTSMGGKLVRSIGKVRAETNIGLKNLAFNIKRYIFLEYQAAV